MVSVNSAFAQIETLYRLAVPELWGRFSWQHSFHRLPESSLRCQSFLFSKPKSAQGFHVRHPVKIRACPARVPIRFSSRKFILTLLAWMYGDSCLFNCFCSSWSNLGTKKDERCPDSKVCVLQLTFLLVWKKKLLTNYFVNWMTELSMSITIVSSKSHLTRQFPLKYAPLMHCRSLHHWEVGLH